MMQENPVQLTILKQMNTMDVSDGYCLGVKSNANGILAQHYTNQQIVIYNGECIQQMSTDTDIFHLCWAHPQSRNNQYLYYFGSEWGAIDVEKMVSVFSIGSEMAVCGDVNIANEICTAHDKAVVFWDLRQKLPINCILANSMRITSCEYNYNGKYITTTAQDNCSRIFDCCQLECQSTISASKKKHTTSSQFTRDSKHILVSTLEEPLTVWDWAQSNLIASYKPNNQSRYYIQPLLLYDDQLLPQQILYPDDSNHIYVFDFMNPEQQPIIVNFDHSDNNQPIRIEQNRHSIQKDIIYIYTGNQIYMCQYNALQ